MPETKKYCTTVPEKLETLPTGILDGLTDNEEEGFSGTDGPIETCEKDPKSIGCKVLGDQFIFTINGLVKDLEELKPPGYILAVGKLKGAIIKLQAGN